MFREGRMRGVESGQCQPARVGASSRTTSVPQARVCDAWSAGNISEHGVGALPRMTNTNANNRRASSRTGCRNVRHEFEARYAAWEAELWSSWTERK